MKAAKAEEVERKPAVCFVIGATANAQAPNFNSPLIQDTVLDCARNYGFVAVVNAAGNRKVVVMNASTDIAKQLMTD